MVVIAVMPAGWVDDFNREINPYDQPEFSSTCYYRWNSRTNRLGLSETFTSSLPLLSVVAGPKNVQGAFAAGLSFILINRITGAVFGVTSATLADKTATVHTIFGGSIKVADYFISVLEAPALNMGVFVGIISRFRWSNCLQ